MPLLNLNKTAARFAHGMRACVIALIVPLAAIAQHNGDPLLFQGVTEHSAVGVKGMALGNTFVSRSNDLNTLFYNAAGLADLRSVQISVSSHYKDQLTRDNQNFYPGSGYVGTSLYLEHLLIPDPAWNNLWDDSLRTIVYDSLGSPIGSNWWNADKLLFPVQGADDYSHEAADHEKMFNHFDFDHVALAVPFDFVGKHFVAAASYSRQFDVYDYDWNGAHLDPHWGSSDIIQDTSGAIVRSNWSVFTRERTGGLYAFTGALAFQLDEHFQFGAKVTRQAGETEDEQTLDRIGYFRFKHGANQSRWSFSYDANTSRTRGTSMFRSTNLNVGGLYVSSSLNLGINIQLPYSIEREWSYLSEVQDSLGITSINTSGVDLVNMPAIYTAGISIKPGKGLTFSFAFEYNGLSAADYHLSENTPDSLTIYTRWVDQVSLRFGVEYLVDDALSLLAGYQSQGAPFIGNGVAVRDAGAPCETYSCGLSLNVLFGRVDVAYSHSELKYFDVYMTNRNFTFERLQRVSLGYTLTLWSAPVQEHRIYR